MAASILAMVSFQHNLYLTIQKRPQQIFFFLASETRLSWLYFQTNL